MLDRPTHFSAFSLFSFVHGTTFDCTSAGWASQKSPNPHKYRIIWWINTVTLYTEIAQTPTNVTEGCGFTALDHLMRVNGVLSRIWLLVCVALSSLLYICWVFLVRAPKEKKMKWVRCGFLISSIEMMA